MKEDDAAPDVPPASLNPEKDPDEWVTKDEPMTGALISPDPLPESRRRIQPKLDQGGSFEKKSRSCSRKPGVAKPASPRVRQA